jgi:hypothetical protein
MELGGLEFGLCFLENLSDPVDLIVVWCCN